MLLEGQRAAPPDCMLRRIGRTIEIGMQRLGSAVAKVFSTFKEAQILMECRREEYNTVRPRNAFGFRSPAPEAIEAFPGDPGFAVLRQDLWFNLTAVLT